MFFFPDRGSRGDISARPDHAEDMSSFRMKQIQQLEELQELTRLLLQQQQLQHNSGKKQSNSQPSHGSPSKASGRSTPRSRSRSSHRRSRRKKNRAIKRRSCRAHLDEHSVGSTSASLLSGPSILEGSAFP